MATGSSQESLEALYERYGHRVHARCLYLLRDEAAAWDATQDVFLKADAARAGFEGRSSWLTWLTRIATHHCLNVLRSRRVRRGAGLVDAGTLEGRRDPRDSEKAAMVRGLLEMFDVKTQRVAVHYYVDEMSQEEVAEVVGLSVPTVRKRLREFVTRARRELERMPPGVARSAS